MSRKKIKDKIGIYKITNVINGKLYIGQSKEIRKRWKRHIKDIEKGKHRNAHLKRAFDNYGQENFKFEVIEECKEEQLDEREIYWISYYDSNNYKNGYNQDSGGNSNKKLNDDVKERIRKSREYGLGEDAVGSKLTNEQVVQIKKILYEGILACKDIGDIFGVGEYIIQNIKNGKSYSNVITPYDETIKNIKLKNSRQNQINGVSGENSVNAIINEQIVKEIKYMLSCNTFSAKQIAKKFNISSSLVYDIKHFRAWKHVTTEYDNIIKELNSSEKRTIIRERVLSEKFINEVTLIKKELATTNKTKLQISEEFKGRSRGLITDIAKLKSYTNIAPEYNSILKEKYSGSQREVLNEEQVKEIKKMLAEQNLKDKEIAETYNIKHTTIQSIRLLKTWVNVASEYNELIKQKQIKSKQSA